MTKKITVLPGDGIGPEIIAEALKVLAVITADMNLAMVFEDGLIGGAAYDVFGTPFPAVSYTHLTLPTNREV